MNYTKQDIIDSSEINESGEYDYIYEYTLYYFKVDEVTHVFRSYKDTYDKVAFLRKEIKGEILELNKSQLNEIATSSIMEDIVNTLKVKENKSIIEFLFWYL